MARFMLICASHHYGLFVPIAQSDFMQKQGLQAPFTGDNIRLIKRPSRDEAASSAEVSSLATKVLMRG